MRPGKNHDYNIARCVFQPGLSLLALPLTQVASNRSTTIKWPQSLLLNHSGRSTQPCHVTRYKTKSITQQILGSLLHFFFMCISTRVHFYHIGNTPLPSCLQRVWIVVEIDWKSYLDLNVLLVTDNAMELWKWKWRAYSSAYFMWQQCLLSRHMRF